MAFRKRWIYNEIRPEDVKNHTRAKCLGGNAQNKNKTSYKFSSVLSLWSLKKILN